MKNRLVGLALLLLLSNWAQATPKPPPIRETEAKGAQNQSQSLAQWNGFKIKSIQVQGLERTRESAVRWLLPLKEGDVFNDEEWQRGIHNLYNTWVLYDLYTEATETQGQVSLNIHLKDKWTFYPFLYFQLGGGLVNYGGGLLDFNLAGNLTTAFVFASVTNHYASYEINVDQEWIGNSPFMSSLDLMNAVTPYQSINGNAAESLTWRRGQIQWMFGGRIGKKIRLFNFAEMFQDSLLADTSVADGQVYNETQYRMRPTLIYGRVNYSNYLEEGSELTLAPTFSNFFDSAHSYTTLSLTFKDTHVVREVDNFAYFINLNWMTQAPLPYQFHLGGFDSIRGFTAFRLMGPNTAYTNIEYRPLIYQRDIGFFNIDHAIMQGCVFSDMGGTYGLDNSQFLMSAGLGLRFFLVRYAGAIFRIDLARTITPDEGFEVSLGVSQLF